MGRHRGFVMVGVAVLLGLALGGCASYDSTDLPDATGGQADADAAKEAPSTFALNFTEQQVNTADAAASENNPNEAKTFKKGTHAWAVTNMDKGPYPTQTSCLSCKSATFLGQVNDGGAAAAYGRPYAEARAAAGGGMTCYSCHADTPGTLRVTSKAFAEGLGDEAKKVDGRSLACMQCHAESYVDAKTGETRFPYKYGFDPASILKYYDEIGFSDSVDEKTGAKLLNVEHGQGESYVGGSHFLKGVDCPDCHIIQASTSDGDEYTDHAFVMSMETPEVMTESCLNNCHKGKTVEELRAQVDLTQKKGSERMKIATDKVEEFHAALAKAVSDKKLSADKLDEARSLYRQADFYVGLTLDSPLGETNGNLFHNNMLTIQNAETAEALAKEGMKLLGG